jgi:hypothetical protein
MFGKTVGSRTIVDYYGPFRKATHTIQIYTSAVRADFDRHIFFFLSWQRHKTMSLLCSDSWSIYLYCVSNVMYLTKSLHFGRHTDICIINNKQTSTVSGTRLFDAFVYNLAFYENTFKLFTIHFPWACLSLAMTCAVITLYFPPQQRIVNSLHHCTGR